MPTNGTACASASGTGNNGNLLSQTITMPGLSQLTQTYLYDHLNRLTQAQETGGGANWSQTYSYDAVGNRWIVPTQSTGLPALTLKHPRRRAGIRRPCLTRLRHGPMMGMGTFSRKAPWLGVSPTTRKTGR